MSISGDYPHPVNVNGYSCKNCTDVDYAKKHIDPAHPKSGPYGVNAKSDPTTKNDDIIKLGGRLADEKASASRELSGAQSIATTAQAAAVGQTVNILA